MWPLTATSTASHDMLSFIDCILCGMDCYLLLHPSGLLTGLIVATLVPFSHFQFHGNYFVKVCIKSGVVSVQIYQTICLFQKKRGTTKPLQAHALKCPDQVFCPSSFFSPCYCFSTKSQRSQLSDAWSLSKKLEILKIMENSGLEIAQNLLLVLHPHAWVYLIYAWTGGSHRSGIPITTLFRTSSTYR